MPACARYELENGNAHFQSPHKWPATDYYSIDNNHYIYFDMIIIFSDPLHPQLIHLEEHNKIAITNAINRILDGNNLIVVTKSLRLFQYASDSKMDAVQFIAIAKSNATLVTIGYACISIYIYHYYIRNIRYRCGGRPPTRSSCMPSVGKYPLPYLCLRLTPSTMPLMHQW